jgi:TolA-binding protein
MAIDPPREQPPAEAPIDPEAWRQLKTYDGDEPDAAMQQLWAAGGNKITLILGGLLLLFLLVKGVGRLVSGAQAEVYNRGQGIQKARDQEEADRLDRESRRALKERFGEDPTNAAQAVQRAAFLARSGDPALALDACDDLQRRFPRGPEAKEAIFFKGLASLRAHEPAPAAEYLSQTLAGESQHVEEALFLRGQAYAASGENDAAHRDFTKLLAEHGEGPFTAEAYVASGEVNARLGKASDAESDFKTALTLPNASSDVKERARSGLKALSSAAVQVP